MTRVTIYLFLIQRTFLERDKKKLTKHEISSNVHVDIGTYLKIFFPLNQYVPYNKQFWRTCA